MEIYKQSGTHVVFKNHHILLDPLANKESDIALISHAHSDHVSLQALKSMKQPIYMSQPTLEVLNERAKTEFKNQDIHIIKNGDQINLNGINITIFDAGHCIGSLQFRIQDHQKIVIYTGDFCVEPRMGMQKGSILRGKSATLITDSTYSAEKYVFPERMEIYKKILQWVESVFKNGKKIAIFFARQLGTAQEITDLINKSTLDCDIWVHPSIYYHNLIHAKYYPLGKFQYRRNLFDSSLEDFFIQNEKRSKLRRRKIFILPIFLYSKKYLPEIKKIYGKEVLAVCTGWALTQNFSVQSFALSSHADHKDIQQYFKESGAKDLLYF